MTEPLPVYQSYARHLMSVSARHLVPVKVIDRRPSVRACIWIRFLCERVDKGILVPAMLRLVPLCSVLFPVRFRGWAALLGLAMVGFAMTQLPATGLPLNIDN